MKISLAEAGNILTAAKKIVITAHENPDGDAIGSSLGLMYYLRSIGKSVTVMLDDDIPANFSVLPGTAEIIRPDGAESDADLLVVLDSSLDRIGSVQKHCLQAKVLNLDHHVSNDGKAEYVYVDSSRAAVAEIIYELLKLLKADFSVEAAEAVFTGLATDTGFFKYSNTTPYTMRAAAECIERGAKPHIISEALEAKPYAEVKGMAAAMQTIEIVADGKIAGMYLDLATMQTIDSTEGFIDFVRIIDGVEVAVLIKNIDRQVCRVSMRSKGFDVNQVAMSLGGGGHVRAAGCTLHCDLAEAKTKVLNALTKAMGE